MLRRHVVDCLVPVCRDESYGGFLVDFDDRWRPTGPHVKTLEHVARTTASFARLHRLFPLEGLDALAARGIEYLKDTMWDHANGGFFTAVHRSGEPCYDGLKHPHGHAYVNFALVSATELLPNLEPEKWIGRTMGWLDDVAWDTAHGGYWGSYRRDNTRYEGDTALPTLNGRDPLAVSTGFKEINTLGDSFEMLLMLDARSSVHLNRERLAWMEELVCTRLVRANGAVPYLYHRDWSVALELPRVGYHFQLVRHLLRADALHSSDCALAETALRIVTGALARARHPDGGFVLALAEDGRHWPTAGGLADERQWWVQFEALHAFHLLANHRALATGCQTRFAQCRDEQWRFIADCLLDERYGGVREVPLVSTAPWLQPRKWAQAWRGRPQAPKTNGWKDPWHEVSCLLSVIEEPRGLTDRSDGP